MFIKYVDVSYTPYYEQNKSVDISNNFKQHLFEHQLDGVRFGMTHNGFILGDQPGLGKTCQMICLAETLKKQENIEHCLIICGVNGLKYNWVSEISKFSDLSCRILGQYTNRNNKLAIRSVSERCAELLDNLEEFFIITNVETLQSKEFYKCFSKSKNKFGMIVFDEIHKVKSPSSLSAKTFLKLKSPHNIGLTGTLILSNPNDAYVPLKWVGGINCNFTEFKRTYNVFGGFNSVQLIGYKNLSALKECLSKCSLRRLKKDVLDLPSKTFKIDYVEMGDEQQKLYDEISLGIAAELDKLPKDKQLSIAEEMVMHMRQRQVTACPSMLTSLDVPSAKLDRLEDLVSQIVGQGDKVIVFSTFKETTKEIYRRLQSYGVVVCTGDSTENDLYVAKKEFESNANVNVLVATWQKMGTGHNLVSANYVIFVDTPWTYAEFEQCTDRVYRIGQMKNVHIITLVTKNTYDERVQQLVELKESVSDYIIN